MTGKVEYTRSSAIAERPRDALCLYSFNYTVHLAMDVCIIDAIIQTSMVYRSLIIALRRYASAVYAAMRCTRLCVCQSVCLSRSYILSKRITHLQFFLTSVSHTILVFFRTKPYGDIPTGTSLLTGSTNRGVKSREISPENLLLSLTVGTKHSHCSAQ